MSDKLNVLIIDDEEIVHKTLGGFIKELGHQVDLAHNGNVGLDALTQNTYDLALIDVRMPGMDGMTLLQKIAHICPELNTIIITGHGDPVMKEKAIALGVMDFLVKPISLAKLQEILASVNRNQPTDRHSEPEITTNQPKGINKGSTTRIKHLKTLHILVVDDEEIVRKTLVRFLEEFGHQVQTANSGLLALETAKTKTYDLVLVDLNMPGISGLNLIAQMRTTFPDLPIVIVSGHSSETLTEEASKLGVSDFLEKPFHFGELEKIIAKQADHSHI